MRAKRTKRLRGRSAHAVYTTFITALEREDIEALSNALYKIPKTVDKFSRPASWPRRNTCGAIDFSKQISLLERATDIVLELVKSPAQRHGPGEGQGPQ